MGEDGPGKERRELLDSLRKEANDVKDCFTKYSYQTIAITVVVLGLIIRFQMQEPMVGAAGSFVILLVMFTARLGIYKYGTANRIFGYELHLDRIKDLPESSTDGWKRDMADIGWEEALKAWRVVQATVFEHLYEEAPFFDSINHRIHRRLRLDKNKRLYKLLTSLHRKKSGWEKSDWGIIKLKDIHEEGIKYKWFVASSLVNRSGGGRYHSGNYLKTVLGVLYILAYLALIPILISSIQYFFDPCHKNYILGVLFLLFFLYMFLAVFSRSTRSDSRRNLLQDGLLSIHSCAIMWHAVVVAHFRALKQSPQEEQLHMKGYVGRLSNESIKLIDNGVENIHEWVK